MVLDGLKWFEAKNQKSMTINDKSATWYLISTHRAEILNKKPNREHVNNTHPTSIDDISGSIHDIDLNPSQDEGQACPLSDYVQ